MIVAKHYMGLAHGDHFELDGFLSLWRSPDFGPWACGCDTLKRGIDQLEKFDMLIQHRLCLLIRGTGNQVRERKEDECNHCQH